MCTGFTLSQEALPAARAVGGGEVLDDDALVAAFQGVGEERVGRRAGRVLRVGDEGAADPQVLGEEPGQGGVAVGEGQVEQLLVVDEERVEEDRDDGHVRRRLRHVSAASPPGRRSPGRAGAGRPPQGDHLAVQDEAAGREGGDGGGQLGQPFGDVVEGPGVGADTVAVAVDLHPDTVELLLDRARSQFVECLADRGGGVRQHRLDGPSDGEPEGGERLGPVREEDPGDLLERSGEHHGAPDVGGRGVGGTGQGVGRDGVQGPLAHLAGEQGPQEALFVLGGGGEEGAQVLLAPGLGAGAESGGEGGQLRRRRR